MSGPADPQAALCRLDDIAPGESIGLNAEIDGQPRRLMIVRRGDDVFAYVNSCPHTGAPLDMRAGKFLNLEKTHILCANHGALFDQETGFCRHGPCVGESLEKIPLILRDGALYLGF